MTLGRLLAGLAQQKWRPARLAHLTTPSRKGLVVKPDQFVTFFTCNLVLVLKMSENVSSGPKISCNFLKPFSPKIQLWVFFYSLISKPAARAFPSWPLQLEGLGANPSCKNVAVA